MKRKNSVSVEFSMGVVFVIFGVLTALAIVGAVITDENIQRADLLIILLFFILFGILFTAIGVWLIRKWYLKNQKYRALMADGERVYAQIVDGIVNYHVAVNKKHPYQLKCRYEDTFSGQTHFFMSEDTWLYPGDYIGQDIVVYLDKTDSSNYYVDLESIHSY